MKKSFSLALLFVMGCCAAMAAGEPSMKCSYGSCTAENGFTDEMVTKFKTKEGNFENKSLTLNNVSNEDLKKLPALKDSLEKLTFWEKGSQLTDLTPLAALPALKALQVRECDNLTDLAPIGKLTNLETLDLYNLGKVTDLTPLGGLTKLTSLSMTNLGKPIDLAPLSKLVSLKELKISQGVAYTSFAFLAPLVNLEKVNFLAEPADVTDISALAGKTKLTELTFSRAKITDLSPLKDSAALTKLSINGSAPRDLSVIAGLKKLSSLDLSGISTANLDLTPVGSLPELTALDLSNSAFADFKPLAKCLKLESLKAMSKSNFAQLEILAALPNFKRLNVWENKSIQDWKPLAELVNLETLHVGRTSFTDLKLTAKMTKLKELGFNDCTVTGFETVAALPSLTNLIVSGAKGIADITVLKTSPQLGRIYVSHGTDQFPKEQTDALKAAQEEAKKKPAK